MNFKLKYKLCLWKGYFEKGLSLLHYVIYLIGFFALASKNVYLTFIVGVIFAIISFFLGWAWYHFNWMKAEIEVNNNYNLFVKQMRRKIKKKSL